MALPYRWISLAALASVSMLSLPACTAVGPDSQELIGSPEAGAKNEGAVSGSMPVGSILVATGNVNLRTGPGTTHSVLHVVPKGSQVTLVASDPQNGFYNVKHNGSVGWSFGNYYDLVSSPQGGSGGAGGAASGGGGAPSGAGGAASGSGGAGGSGPPPMMTARDAALVRARSGVGFSYWWGHGRFRPEGPSQSNAGTCNGSCPNCSHGGQYGGDCSGFVGKVWEVPDSNSDLTVDSHPYSTSNFVNDSSQWSTVSRSSLQPADAMVYNSGGHGHIFLYSSGDGWGSMDTYECKGCAAGCVHDLRSASSAYHGIRRSGY